MLCKLARRTAEPPSKPTTILLIAAAVVTLPSFLRLIFDTIGRTYAEKNSKTLAKGENRRDKVLPIWKYYFATKGRNYA